jgi:sigma-B regulation protein RsbU (phosphoserine phosphatase)
MMISKTLIKSAAQSGLSPKALLEKVNNQLCENNDAEMFVTVWLGILEISTGRIVASNAGHEKPVIIHSDGRAELIDDKHGFVVGGMGGVKYPDYELQLEPGDKLFVYTDGVPEATSKMDGLFGTDRMVAALEGQNESSAEEVLKSVQDAVDDFVGDDEQFDDLTMLCLDYRGK